MRSDCFEEEIFVKILIAGRFEIEFESSFLGLFVPRKTREGRGEGVGTALNLIR